MSGLSPDALRPLPRRFFARPVLRVARDLLGRLLVHQTPKGRMVGRIVEVEAYRGRDDPASHAYRLTPRSKIMAGLPGMAYVYFSYGNHFCLNVVAEREGRAAAILLRAVEPLQGIALMARHRGVDLRDPAALRRLAAGPGRLTRAMNITGADNGRDLTRPPLYIGRGLPGRRLVGRSPRVGVRRAADRPWRFYLRDSPYLSRAGTSPMRAGTSPRRALPSRRARGAPRMHSRV